MKTLSPTYPFRRRPIERHDPIQLPTRFDVHAVDAFDTAVARQLDHGVTRLVLDAGLVKHLDQAGIDALAAAQCRVEEADVSFSLIASTAVRVALELTGFVPLATRTEALAA